MQKFGERMYMISVDGPPRDGSVVAQVVVNAEPTTLRVSRLLVPFPPQSNRAERDRRRSEGDTEQRSPDHTETDIKESGYEQEHT